MPSINSVSVSVFVFQVYARTGIRCAAIASFCCALLVLGVPAAPAAANDAVSEAPARARVQVYKTPTCGCCKKWIRHLEQAGFEVTATDVPDTAPIKRQNGLLAQLASCHTAIVGGYLVEGHVPAEDVVRLLETRPAVAGLAVPRMPIGSPGMEGPNPVPYDVYSFDAEGQVEVFSSHAP